MFKTPLQLNKESLVVGSVIMLILFVVAMNLLTIVPSLISTYKPDTLLPSNEPIDTKAVNEAIKYIENK